MNDFTDRLRAATDYIDKHDVPKLLSVSVDTGVIDFHGMAERDELTMFLSWSETLDGDVKLIAKPYGETYHLHARGLLPGTRHLADIVVVVAIFDYPALPAEIGPGGDKIPVTREQLAKIATAVTS